MKSTIGLGATLAFTLALWGCSPKSDTAPASTTKTGEPVAQVGPESAQEAWWLRIEFEPTQEAIRGIPVAQLDASWVQATELNKDLVPKQLLQESGGDRMAAAKQEFSRSGDFNRDGVTDEALVGVYRDKQGNRGKFLLIISQREGRWEKLFLETDPSRAGYSALGLQGDNLTLWSCMECGAVSELAWHADIKRFAWVEPPLESEAPQASQAPETTAQAKPASQ